MSIESYFNTLFQGFKEKNSLIMNQAFSQIQKKELKQFNSEILLKYKQINQDFHSLILKYIEYKNQDQQGYLDKFVEQLILIMKDQNYWFIKFGKHLLRQLKQIDLDYAIKKLRHFLGELQSIRSQKEVQFCILFCINELLWCFFKLVNYHQCRSFLSIIESKYKDIFSEFPIGDKLNFHYYSGRMALFENQFLKAKQQFSECIRLMQNYKGSNSHQIYKQIYKYFIPVQILNGNLPSPNLINKYTLTEYSQLTIAIRQGNQLLFNKEVEKHYYILLKRGLYLIIEKFQQILIRNLIKKAYVLYQQTYLENKIETVIFQQALNFNSFHTNQIYSLDQTEFILANLFFQGFIKGYVSHEHRTIVFSKNQPFVKIQDVVAKQSS